MNDELKVFHVDDGEDWWIVAIDETDALEVAKTMDIGIDDDFKELVIEEMPMDEVFTVHLVDGYLPEERELYPAGPSNDDEKGWKVTATIRQWLSVSRRGDCIATSMF